MRRKKLTKENDLYGSRCRHLSFIVSMIKVVKWIVLEGL